MNLWDRLAVALRVLLAPSVEATRAEEPEEPRFPRTPNPLLSNDGAAARQEAALGLMDEDCQGFVLLTVRRQRDAPYAEVCMQQHVDAAWWPGIALTMERIAREARAAS